MSAPIISPVLGLVILGPYPPKGGLGDDVHLNTLYLISPASHSASLGWTLTSKAFLKPAFSKASFQAKTPSLIVSLHSCGVEFSIHHVIGVTGSDIAWSVLWTTPYLQNLEFSSSNLLSHQKN